MDWRNFRIKLFLIKTLTSTSWGPSNHPFKRGFLFQSCPSFGDDTSLKNTMNFSNSTIALIFELFLTNSKIKKISASPTQSFRDGWRVLCNLKAVDINSVFNTNISPFFRKGFQRTTLFWTLKTICLRKLQTLPDKFIK